MEDMLVTAQEVLDVYCKFHMGIARLAVALKDGDDEQRRWAFQTLAEIGMPAAPLLVQALCETEEPGFALRILGVLEVIGQKALLLLLDHVPWLLREQQNKYVKNTVMRVLLTLPAEVVGPYLGDAFSPSARAETAAQVTARKKCTKSKQNRQAKPESSAANAETPFPDTSTPRPTGAGIL